MKSLFNTIFSLIIVTTATVASAQILECGWTSTPGRVQSGTEYTIAAYAHFGASGGGIDLMADSGYYISPFGEWVEVSQSFTDTGNKTVAYTAMVWDDTGPNGAEYLYQEVEIYTPNNPPTVTLTVNGVSSVGGATSTISITTGAALQISTSASDPDGNYQSTRVWININNTGWTEIRNVSGASDSFQYTLTAVGYAWLHCRSLDAAGVESSTAIINVTVVTSSGSSGGGTSGTVPDNLRSILGIDSGTTPASDTSSQFKVHKP